MKAGRMANGFLFCDHRPHLHKHTKTTVFPIAAWDRHLRLHSIPSFGYEQRVPLGGGEFPTSNVYTVHGGREWALAPRKPVLYSQPNSLQHF